MLSVSCPPCIRPIAVHCSSWTYFNPRTREFRDARGPRRCQHHGNHDAPPERERGTPLRWKNVQLTFVLQYATCSTRESSTERKRSSGVTRSILDSTTMALRTVHRNSESTRKHWCDDFSVDALASYRRRN